MAKRSILLAAFFVAALAGGLRAESVYTQRPDDGSLVVLSKEKFPGLHGDGVGDDTEAVQEGINEASANGLVLLVPEGRYLLSRTVGIPPSTRVIGFGKKRPVFVLGAKTAGYSGDAVRYMIWFSGGNRRGGRNGAGATNAPAGAGGFSDASSGTFYSGLVNVDFEIGEGNPMAAAIRSHYAQHCVIAHVDFNLGSGFAGIDAVGNEAEDLHFHGGSYGIVSAGTAPGWQFTLVDSSFDGQRVAAIKTHNTGMTLVCDQFEKVPTAVAIDENDDERLWMSDCVLKDVSGSGIVVGNEGNLRTQINLENVACLNVPVMAAFMQSKTMVPWGGANNYSIKRFSYGLQFASVGDVPEFKETYEAEDLVDRGDKYPALLPLPGMETWVSVKDFGAVGDGKADDLGAFEKAIAVGKPVFVPAGRYRVSDSIELGKDTVLIGLSPITTQIAIDDGAKNFSGAGDFKGVIETPVGGKNIVRSIGVDSGANCGRAVGIKWQGGERSMINDVKFLGGHGTWIPGGARIGGPYNADHSGDSNPSRKWSAERPSLWVTHGGGVLANIWTASTFSSAGMLVEDTDVPGRVYELSSEHHVVNEVMYRHVSGWKVFAEQTEEEWGEGPTCLPLLIDGCRDMLFANTIFYRVSGMRTPGEMGAEVLNSRGIRFRGIHSYGQNPYAFDKTVVDGELDNAVMSREVGAADVTGDFGRVEAVKELPMVGEGASMMRVGDGFTSADHAITDGAGDVYFVDMFQNKVWKYAVEEGKLSVVRSDVEQPFALAIDGAGDLMILSHAGRVFAVPLKDAGGKLVELKAVPAEKRPEMAAWLPVDRWWDHEKFPETKVEKAEPLQFLSPDGTCYVPVPNDFSSGRQRPIAQPPINLFRKYQIAAVKPGERFYEANENYHQTWKATAGDDGTLKDATLFAPHGEAGVTTDAEGNVYICEGYVFVYDAKGKWVGTIEVPERPLSVVFCGKERDVLFITGRRAVYALKMKVKG